MKFRRTLIAISLLALAGCGGADEPARPSGQAAVGVVVGEVVYQAERSRVEAVGTARARSTADIFPENGGEVISVEAGAGDRVEAGATLVRLDDREERIAARLAEVSVAEAEQLLARYRRIEDSGAVSASQIDEARTALDAARLELEQAELALSQRTVRAPFAGHVGILDVDPGQRVTTQTALARLDDRSVLFVDFNAPEQVFGNVKSGEAVNATPFADAATVREARIVAVDTRIDATRRSFRIRTEIDNADDALRPGMSFSVGFDIMGQRQPTVPETAILWGSDGSYVWRVIDETAKRVPVTIVHRDEGSVLVRGDLPEGSLIITEGVHKVRDGQRVAIVGGLTEGLTVAGGVVTGTE